MSSHFPLQSFRPSRIPAKVIAGEGKTHGTINSDLGRPDDPPTQAVFEFLEGALKK